MSILRKAWHLIPHEWRVGVRPFRIRVLRKLGLLKGDRIEAGAFEASFWRKALADGGKIWGPDMLKERTDPNTPLRAELCELLAGAGATVRLLDVGAGPLTTLGKTWPGHSLEISAVDPLAGEYDEILSDLQIVPPVRTTAAFAERLTEIFPRDYFDLTSSSNALDHAIDPILAIREMLAVTRPGGYAYLWHFANEGESEGYTGFHQWNFNCRGDDMIVDNGKMATSLREAFKDVATVNAKLVEQDGQQVVVAVLQRNS